MMMVLLFKDSIVIRIVKIVLKIVKELMILFVDMKLFFLVELIDNFWEIVELFILFIC